MEIDFIEVKGDKTKIDEALNKLVSGKIKNIKISNIASSSFTDMYDVDDVEECNGWQCDWWSNMHYKDQTFGIFGEAWYGRITISNEGEE